MWENELDKLRKLQAARLKEARILRGYKSGSAAARRFGWPVPTYNAHERGGDSGRGIARMYREYAKKFRVNPEWLLGHGDERDSIVRGVKVIGDAAIGTWREDTALKEQDEPARIVGVPTLQEHDADEQFAVRVADASMNKEFPQGSFAICVNSDDNAEYEVGQVLYIERVRGDMVELSLRRVASVTTNGGMRLTAYSVDPKFKQELTFPATKNDERIRILGRVVGKYQDFTHA